MQTDKEQLLLKEACQKFATLNLKVKSGSVLFAIFGHKKAGKTITVDLLEGTQLTFVKDLEEKTSELVRQNNRFQPYATTLMAVHKERIIAESFTLQECSQEGSAQQAVKLIYLKELLKIAQKVSLIIVCEEKSLASIHLHLQQFLGCLGISAIKKDKRLEAVREYIYLLVTKTKEARLESCLKTMAGIKAKNENAAELIQYFINSPKRCKLFPAMQPSPAFAKEVFDAFSPKKKSNDLLGILEQSCLKKKQAVFAEKDIKYIFDILVSISKMLRCLIQYGLSKEKTEYRRSYERQSKQFFYMHLNKRKVQKMIGNWTVECLPEAMPVVGQGRNQMVCLAEWLMQLCVGFESSNTVAQLDFKEWRLMVLFCCKLQCWLKMDEQNQEKVNQEINNHQGLHQKYAPKPKPKPKEAKKKPYQLFYESIKEHCKTNLDALQLCLRDIKEKQKQANFDCFDVIFQIKLLLHLLDCLNSQHPHLFIKELLELSLYSESSFLLFSSYLQTALTDKLLDYRQSMTLIRQLLARQKYHECLRIINYQAAFTIEPEHYNRFLQLKNMIRTKKGQQLNAVDKSQRQGSKILSFSFQTIEAKTKNNFQLQHFLSRDNYSHFFSK